MGFLSFLSKKKKPNKTLSVSTETENLSNRGEAALSSSVNSTVTVGFEEVFKKFDVDGDGKISYVELGSILSTLGYEATSEELEVMVKEVDSDGDGFIDLNEFLELNKIDSEKQVKDIEEAFAIVDTNGDGSISPSELQKLLKTLGDESSISDCKKIIKNFDCDGDGLISLDEFKKMMFQGSNFLDRNGN
ncbi:hypothetical protein MKW98_023812 [Papaver atlanticum]|uniref:EF-hand domain-containing protein n=1 Tax=Papaver atlanticum TaxID=357466 RepID=A0AAD4SZ14_9MAGN|nr:hypothetical protein MKW98_023812 [Papaver atlanticum]